MSELKKLHDLTVEIEETDDKIKSLEKIASIVADTKKRGVGVGMRIIPSDEEVDRLKSEAINNIQVIKVDMEGDGGFDIGKVMDKAMKEKDKLEEKMDEINPQVSIEIDESEAFLVIEVMMKTLKNKRSELVEKLNNIKVK